MSTSKEDELLDVELLVVVVAVVELTESTSIAFSTQSRPVRGIRAGFRGGSGRWLFGMGGGLAPPRSFCGYPRNGRRKLARNLEQKEFSAKRRPLPASAERGQGREDAREERE